MARAENCPCDELTECRRENEDLKANACGDCMERLRQRTAAKLRSRPAFVREVRRRVEVIRRKAIESAKWNGGLA